MFEKYIEMENLKEIMADANEYVVERIKKLEKLKELGVNPYPYSFKATTHTKYIIDNFSNIKEDELFTLAGRVMLIRRMGNATFLDLCDQDGNIQVFISKKVVGKEQYDLLKLIDVGDIVGIEGSVL